MHVSSHMHVAGHCSSSQLAGGVPEPGHPTFAPDASFGFSLSGGGRGKAAPIRARRMSVDFIVCCLGGYDVRGE
jgi:hypothetical protein